MDEIIGLIRDLGFPIAMVVWFMWRTESVISANTEAMKQMSVAISSCPYKEKK